MERSHRLLALVAAVASVIFAVLTAETRASTLKTLQSAKAELAALSVQMRTLNDVTSGMARAADGGPVRTLAAEAARAGPFERADHREEDQGSADVVAADVAATRPPEKTRVATELEEASRLLRAERFADARAVLQSPIKSRRERHLALAELAEIAFQEHHYGEAVRYARRAADNGGGVRAYVLLGDSYFRLQEYKQAARAYEHALTLDPKSSTARAGLSLAKKRM